jgi:hypothetical protein
MKSPRARATANRLDRRPPRDRVSQAALIVWVVCLTAYWFVNVFIQRVAVSHAWIMGDWLINYSNGFVRRGLIGEICRQLHYLAGFNPISVVVTLKAAFYTTLCASLLVLAARRSIGLIEIAIVLSPAALPFEINDPLGSGRKEIALLAAFALYVVADDLFPGRKRPIQSQWQFWYLLVTLPALTLIHEGLFFFLPFFLAYTWLKDESVRSNALVLGIPSTIATAAFFLSWIFRGGNGLSAAMCSSLTAMSLDPLLCGGATAALEHYDVHIGLLDVLRFLLLATLTFGPLAWYAMKAFSHSARGQFLVSTAVAGAATVPLYLLSEDWGRWIHISAVLMIVTLLACKDVSVRLPARYPAAALAGVAAMSVYVVSWQLPHWIHSQLPILKLP